MRRSLSAWCFVAPALVVITVFFFVPVLAALAMSVTDFDIYALADVGNLRVVGLRNYGELLQTPLFWRVCVHRCCGGLAVDRELVDEPWYLLEGKYAHARGCMHCARGAFDGVGGAGGCEVVNMADVAGAVVAAADRGEPRC